MDERTTRNMLQQLSNQEQKQGIELVKELIQQCQFQKALAECDLALGEKGKDYGYMLQRIRAVVLQGKRESEKANFFLNQLKQAHGNTTLKDIVFLEMNARHHLQSSSFAQAEKAVQQLIEHVGEDSQIGRRFSSELIILAQRYADAERHLAEAQIIHPYDAALYELRGDVLLKELDRTEQALEQFRFAMQMNKRNSSLYSKASAILFNKHFYSEAALHASVALEQLRSDIDATHQQQCLLIRGTSYLNLKETDDALKDFQSLLDTNEKCLPARIGKMKACLVKGKIDQVIAILKKAEELHGVQGTVSRIGCLQNLQSSSIVDQEKVYGQISEIQQEKIDFCEWMALAYFMRKDFDNCEIFLKKKLRRAESLSPPSSLLNYINYWYLQESYAKASMEKSKNALDLKPLNLRDIDIQIVEDLQSEEKSKSNFYEYLQQMILYVFTGLYRWYPQDLYALLIKNKENPEESKVFIRALVHAEKEMQQQQEGKKNYYKSLNNTKVEEKREEQREEMVVAENINSRNKQEEEQISQKTNIIIENHKNTADIIDLNIKVNHEEKPQERKDKPDKITENEQIPKENFTFKKEDMTKVKEIPSNTQKNDVLNISEKVEIIQSQQFIQDNSEIKSDKEIASSSQQNNNSIQSNNKIQEQESKEQPKNLSSENSCSKLNTIIDNSSIENSNVSENQKEKQITENIKQQPQVIEEQIKPLLTPIENEKLIENNSLVMQVQIRESTVNQEQQQFQCSCQQNEIQIKQIDKNDETSENDKSINTHTQMNNNNSKENLNDDKQKNEKEQRKQNEQIMSVNQSLINNQPQKQVLLISDSSVNNVVNKSITNNIVFTQKQEQRDADALSNSNPVNSSQDGSNIPKNEFQQQSFQSPEIVRPNSSCCVIF